MARAALGLLTFLLWLCSPCMSKCASLARGETALRMPLLVSAEEIYYTASAWVDAIQELARELPPALEMRLWERDLDTSVARETLAALSALPVPVLLKTQDKAEMVVPVVENWEAAATQWLGDPENFYIAMLAWLDLQQELAGMEEEWPESLSDIWNQAPLLEGRAEKVDELLSLFPFLAEPRADIFKSGASRSLVGALTVPASALALDRPRLAFASAEDLLSQLEREIPPGAEQAFDYARAVGLFFRGKAQALLAQNALAYLDLQEADRLFASLPVGESWRGQTLAALGDLAAVQQNSADMCEFYRQACAFSNCAPLNSATCP